ncbi:PD-(D/E)XK nuclease family protein [Domibacillus sp. A3M-37]|uniref:RecB family exonuclease n=1 Tax=Domibacillus sp. A3M-37 TaxID=2962037 RepID=UPI0020B6A384|nr:PD-(D/E)XK nuclease family protein [Domibacillus sp. A3M-37]MCP3761205.1 PD-(D/E)XK nuclease family protein [Domibacillus sp. A3M-37]
MFEVKEFPEFSWSFSRHKTLMTCARKYGYDYYAGHNGWLYDADESVKHVYRLKKLKNVPIAFGQIVHELAEKAVRLFLEHGYVMTEAELIGQAREMLNLAYTDSRDRKPQWTQKPARFHMLYDMYYGGELNRMEAEEYRRRLHIVFQNLLWSGSFRDITERPQTMQFQQAEEFRFMTVDGVKIFVVMDLLYRDLEAGKWVIVDWKTGKEADDDRSQLALYAYYIMQKYGASVEEIEIRNEYVLTGVQKSYRLSDADIELMLQKMKQSVHMMRRYQLDMISNEPVELGDFPRTDHERRCETCNYKEICLASS